MKLITIKFRLSILLVFFAITASAQYKSNYASILAAADWGWQSRDGVTYGKASFDDLYGNPQRISIAKYSESSMSTMLYDKEHSSQATNGLAEEAHATAAINGSYFDMSDNTSCTALWMYGSEIATTVSAEYARCNGIVGFKDGVFTLEWYGSSTTASQLAAWGKKYDAFVVSGPILRLNGVSQNPYIGGEGFYGPHPRTMLGKCADGTVYMVITEGRMDGASGFSLPNLLSLAEDLDMTDAINLDGGGSSTLWVTGAGVINKPSGGSLRNVPNIVIATPRHEHNYVNGFCTCEPAPYEPAKLNDKGFYEIDNGGKLFWLATQVNNGNSNASAWLTADIDLENRSWVPMGNAVNMHCGEFDGLGHSIKNLKITTDKSTSFSAFIGCHSGTKDVHNFRISGSVTASGTSIDHFAAGVVAQSTGNHKIQDIWCSVNITNPSTNQVSLRMAGIATRAEGGTINRCVYDGTINGAATNLQVAGILGWPDANNTKVSNCLFAGTLISTGIGSNSAYQGGIVGYSSSTRTGVSFSNNLSIGTITCPKSATRCGALVGNNTSDPSAFVNNYILENLPVTGSSTVTSKVPTVTEVTAAQLTDGTLPEKLNAYNWRQGTDYPVPHDYTAITEDDLMLDGIKYMITGDNTVAVTYPNAEQPSSDNPCSYSGEVTIPATVTIKGKTFNVTAIGDYAFFCADVTALNLPEGITKLGYKAIYQTQLTEIVVPNSVTLMDYEALGYNKVLEKITFGENIAANTWGDKLCIYGGKKYEVYMNCDAVPTLRSYTFDFTGANVHVRPTMYAAFMADPAWSTYDIIGDLWKEYTYEDLQNVINEYIPKLPTGDAVGSDPGCCSVSSVQAMSEAIAMAQALDENATLEQLNKAIDGIIIAYEALYYYPLHEGYYYIESVCFPGYVLQGDPASANRQGLKAVALEDLETPPYFKLVRRNGGWLMQCADNDMYVGTVIGTNSNGKPISLTTEPQYEQVITWAGGGQFKIQGTNTYPYGYTGSRVGVYNYPDGGSLAQRLLWHLHPATAGMFDMDYNLENARVRGFVHDFEYASGEPSKVSTYNQSPPERRDWPLPVSFFWSQSAGDADTWIAWSENPDFYEAALYPVPAGSASYEIYNLIPGRKYYCMVTSGPVVSSQQQPTDFVGDLSYLANFSFTTAGQVRMIKAPGTANVRDLGGWPTASGHPVRYGMIFRGAEWNGGHELEPEGIEALRQAGIKAELDLRSDSEAKGITKSVLGNNILYKRTPLAQTASHMEGLTNSTSTYKLAVQYVLTCVRYDRPVYFHCAIGRDRTGTLAFLLEGVLGVSKSDIYKDYELTNFSYFNTPCSKNQLDEMFAMIEALDGETLEQKFRTYLIKHLGITGSSIDAFRAKMLVDEETAIEQVPQAGSAANAASFSGWFDMSGRRLGRKPTQKGIYIHNRNKEIIR
jgi:hypothetical protein